MNTREDKIWESLLAQSASTFAGDTTPPFGMTTRVLAALRDQEQQEAGWLRIGRRAIFASFGAVAILAIVSVIGVNNDNVDPSVKSLAAIEDAQVS